MPVFQIEENGRRFELEAPSREAAVEALSRLRSQQQAPAAGASSPSQGQPSALEQAWQRSKFFRPAAESIGRALSLPGEVYRGEVPTMQPDEGEGVTSQPLIERGAEAAAVMMPMSPGARRMVPGAAPRAPTREELKAAGSAGFNTARGMGVDYDPAFVSQFASVARAKLEERGFNPLVAKNTFKVLRDLERGGQMPGVYAQFDGLHTAIQALRKGTTDQDNAAGGIVAQALRGVISNPPAQAVVRGPAEELGQVFDDAMGNWAALERSKEVSGRISRAERRASAANSGRNIDNTLRQRVADVLDGIEKGRLKGYSASEVAALNDFVKGNKKRNSARYIANLLGGGGGLGSVVTAMGAGAAGGYAGGTASGLMAGAAIPAIGWGAKSLQNRMGRNAIGNVDEAIRMRSPLYGSMPMGPPRPALGPQLEMNALRALMAQQNGGGGF